MPASVIAAQSKFLNPNMGPVLDLMPRRSCSIRLFRCFDELCFVLRHAGFSAGSSRTARCDAA